MALLAVMGVTIMACSPPPPTPTISSNDDDTNAGADTGVEDDADIDGDVEGGNGEDPDEHRAEEGGVVLTVHPGRYVVSIEDDTTESGDPFFIVPVELENESAGQSIPIGWENYELRTTDAFVVDPSGHSIKLDDACSGDARLDEGGRYDCEVAFEVDVDDPADLLRYTGPESLQLEARTSVKDGYGIEDVLFDLSIRNSCDHVVEECGWQYYIWDEEDEESETRSTWYDQAADCYDRLYDDVVAELSDMGHSCTDEQYETIVKDFADCYEENLECEFAGNLTADCPTAVVEDAKDC